LRNNHTSTHILNFALREVVGDHCDQKGSLVTPEKLRFDFANKGGVTTEQLKKIEEICNGFIKKNQKVYSTPVPLPVAKAIHGLRAVFGETYPDPVRVVSVGFDVDEIVKDVSNPLWKTSSVEFCGGTHVAKTGDIKQFAIMEEGGIAKGIRRIVAVTGDEAVQAQRVANEFKNKLDKLEKMQGEKLEAEIKLVAKELDTLPISAVNKAHMDAEKVRSAAQQKEMIDSLDKYFEENPNAQFIIKNVNVGGNNKAIGAAINHVKANHKQKAIYLFSVASGRVMHQCLVTKDHVGKGLKASEWADVVAKQVGGKKGGKDETAQGSGDKPESIDQAIEAAAEFAKLKIGA
jgi:alanyl-tRNA synthetase